MSNFPYSQPPVVYFNLDGNNTQGMVKELNISTIKEQVIENLSAGICIVDSTGAIVFANTTAANLFGYRLPRHMEGMHWQLLLDKTAADNINSELLKEVGGKNAWQGRVKLLRKNQAGFSGYLSYSKLAEGFCCCMFNDISEQAYKEALLDDLDAAVGSAMDGIALLGPDETYYYLNEKHITHFGYTNASELLGKTWRIFYPDHEIERIEKELFPQLAKEGRWQGETLGKCKNGDYIHQEITLTALSSGGLICIMRNINEKKEQEKLIKKLALVASKTNNAVIITDNKNRVEWINETGENVFNISLKDVTGKDMITHLRDMGLCESRIAALKHGLESRDNRTSEVQLKDKRGNALWIYVNANQVIENNEITHYVYLCMDITTIKEAEFNTIQALEKERSLNEMKTRFVSLASHQFRTPLTSIQSSVDILNIHLQKNEGVEREKLTSHLSKISEEVNRMSELMDNVLVVGKIKAGKISFSPAMHNVVIAAQNIVSDNKLLNYGKEIKMTVKGVARQVECDIKLIEHVLQNLITNALKYSHNIDKTPELEIEFKEREVVFSVLDYGLGVPAEDGPRLFESFFRARNVQNITGTGLGLSIVKEFVELHKGSIHFTSTEGVKTVFTFTLPC